MIVVRLAKLLTPYLASVLGRENLPKPPFILAANHISPLDPGLLFAATQLPIHFLAAGHLFKRRWGFMRLYNELIVRHLGQSIPTGPGSIAECTRQLVAGGIIGIFPEGDIYPGLRRDEIHTGLAIIAQQANVPIVPVRIEGSDLVWKFTETFTPWRLHAVRVTIGVPISPHRQPLKGDVGKLFVTDVMQTIASFKV